MNAQETAAMILAMEKDSKKGKSSFWTPEDGENSIRFLPPLKPNGEVLPYFHHSVHWIDGTPYECLDQSYNDKDGNFHEAESCPACKMSKKLYKLGERGSEENDLAYAISAKDRYIFRIVDRAKDDVLQVTPEFYEVGPAIFKKFLNIMKGGKYGNIVHAAEGRDYTIDKQGTGRRTNYDNSMPEPNILPIFTDKENLRECLTKAVAMIYTDLISFPKATEIKTAVMEFLDPDSADQGTTVAPTVKKTEGTVQTKTEEVVTKTVDAKNTEVETEADDIDDILGEFMN